MKETIITAGAWNPIPWTATTNPSVAARLYPGAVDATPITRLDTQPSAPVFRPFSTRPRPLWVACRNRDRRALQILSFPQDQP